MNPDLLSVEQVAATVSERGWLTGPLRNDHFGQVRARILKTASGCWEWQGPVNRLNGYGVMGRHKMAHRVAWESVNGPIPDGLVIDHLCKNTVCVNPAHLDAVTQRENVYRSPSPSNLNRLKTHCKRGHEFTPENTVLRPGKYTPRRNCRTCLNLRQRELKASRKESS